jgi:hypothetical protein
MARASTASHGRAPAMPPRAARPAGHLAQIGEPHGNLAFILVVRRRCCRTAGHETVDPAKAVIASEAKQSRGDGADPRSRLRRRLRLLGRNNAVRDGSRHARLPGESRGPPHGSTSGGDMGPGFRRDSGPFTVSCPAGRRSRWGTSKEQGGFSNAVKGGGRSPSPSSG